MYIGFLQFSRWANGLIWPKIETFYSLEIMLYEFHNSDSATTSATTVMMALSGSKSIATIGPMLSRFDTYKRAA